MKKMNFFKILMSLIMTLVVTGVFAQTQPLNTAPLITTTTNYVEILQADDAGYTGVGANDFDVHVNYVTVGTNAVLVAYTPAAVTAGAAYTNAAAANIDYYVPLVVIPDPVFNSTLYADPTFTYANITDDATWTWSTTGTDATFVDIDDALEAAFTGGAGLYDKEEYNQRYLNTGTTVEAFTVSVAENSMNAAATAILCSGTASTMSFSGMAPATATEDGTTTADFDLCYSTADGTYNLVLDLTGTPPFYVGLEYTMDEAVSGVTFSSVQNLTNAGVGADINNASGNGGSTLAGTLAGAGLAWTYTIPISVDVDNDNAYTNEVANTEPTEITTYTFSARFVNDYYSRKSDRRGTLGTPNAVGEQNNHVMYAATSGDLSFTLYPAPETGNIFTLPN